MGIVWISARARIAMRSLGYEPFLIRVFFGTTGRSVEGYHIPNEYIDVLLQILAGWGFWATRGAAQRAL